MAIVKFCCDSGANIHSCREETLDTVATLGLGEGEWESMTEEQKYELVKEWAENRLELYWVEQ